MVMDRWCSRRMDSRNISARTIIREKKIRKRLNGLRGNRK